MGGVFDRHRILFVIIRTVSYDSMKLGGVVVVLASSGVFAMRGHGRVPTLRLARKCQRHVIHVKESQILTTGQNTNCQITIPQNTNCQITNGQYTNYPMTNRQITNHQNPNCQI
jgi:hypothetical protein